MFKERMEKWAEFFQKYENLVPEEDDEPMEVEPIPSQPNAGMSGGKAQRMRPSKKHRYRPAAASRRQIRAYQMPMEGPEDRLANILDDYCSTNLQPGAKRTVNPNDLKFARRIRGDRQ